MGIKFSILLIGTTLATLANAEDFVLECKSTDRSRRIEIYESADRVVVEVGDGVEIYNKYKTRTREKVSASQYVTQVRKLDGISSQKIEFTDETEYIPGRSTFLAYSIDRQSGIMTTTSTTLANTSNKREWRCEKIGVIKNKSF